MTNEFDAYRIYYQSAPQYLWQSRVYLLKNSITVGSIFFMKDGVAIPANVEISGYPRIHFPATKFEEIMNILRHEKPLYITLAPSSKIGTISTWNEPVGEEEED